MVGMIYNSITHVTVSDTSYHKILFFHLVLYSEKQTEKLLSRRETKGSIEAAQNAPERRRELQENAESAECPYKTAGKEHAEKAQSHKETIPVYLVFERFRYSERRGAYKNLH